MNFYAKFEGAKPPRAWTGDYANKIRRRAFMRSIVDAIENGMPVASVDAEAHRLRFVVNQYKWMRDGTKESRQSICNTYGISFPEMTVLATKQYYRWKAASEGGSMASRSVEKAAQFV